MKYQVTVSTGCLLASMFLVQLACGGPLGVSASVQPGDDFFAFANDEWLKTTQIPAGKTRWSDRNQIEIATKQQLIALAVAADLSQPGSYQRQAADFYAAYMNIESIEAKGIAPLKPLLQRVDGLRSKIALARLLGNQLRADADPFNFGIYQSPHLFGIAVEHGVHGETAPFAYLMQGGLGDQDRDLYLNPAAETQASRKIYQKHIAHQLQLAGFDRAS
jgi:putative endopeptidase